MENETLPSPITPLLPNSKRLKCLILILFFIAGAIFLGWYFAGQKSIGEITVLDSGGSKKVTTEEKLVRYEGKYFTFLSPESFEVRYEENDVKFPLLERQLLSRTDIEGQKIAVVVQDTTGYSLEEYGAYRLRKMDSATYREEQYEKNGLNITLFTKSSPVFESGAFWQLENKTVSLILSSPLQATKLEEELQSMLESLEIK